MTVLVWEAAAAVQAEPTRLGAVLALFSVVSLGMLPRLALMASGLTALDDRRAGGTSVSRHHVHNALAAAHRGSLWPPSSPRHPPWRRAGCSLWEPGPPRGR